MRPSRAARRAVVPLALAVAVAIGAPGCAGEDGHALPHGRVTIGGQTVEVEVARTVATRRQGLSGRRELAPGRGLLFLHGETARHAYWMKDMHFAIDILWLRAGRVVDVAHRVPPPPPGTPDDALPTYAPRAEADAVLEVPAGYARMHGFDVGQKVTIELTD